MSDPHTSTSKGRAKRARLGRGLQSMIETKPPASGDTDPESRDHTIDTPGSGGSTGESGNGVARGGGVHELPCDAIAPNAQQPRESFDEQALGELADSIRVHGVLQPVTVRRSADDPSRYELIAGERRWRAAKAAGLGTVPAIVRDADDADSAQLALIENIQREDLNPIERARALRDLVDRHGMTQERVARAVGVSRSSVANTLRLLDLPGEVVEMVRDGVLSVGHAKVLLSAPDADLRVDLATRCRREGWNVRTLERRIAGGGWGESTQSPRGAEGARDRNGRAAEVLRDLERRLGESLGTDVKIRTRGDGTRGRVEIAFYDLDQFDGVLERFGLSDSG